MVRCLLSRKIKNSWDWSNRNVEVLVILTYRR